MNNLESFRLKYSKYKGFKEFLLLLSTNNLKNKTFYPSIKTQTGGSKIEKINQVLKNFKEYDIKIDELDTDDPEIRIEFYSTSKEICFAVLIDQKSLTATIQNLRHWNDCLVNTSSDQITKVLMKIIIEICKQAGIKTLKLTDRSYFSCKNPKFTFFLKQANTLTSSQPYYYNYGFKFVDPNDHSNVKTNAKILQGIKTSDLKFEVIENLIRTKLSKYKKDFDSQIINDTIEYVKEIYTKYLSYPIAKFLSKLKYKLCVVFSVIYFDLFDILKLKNYRTEQMYLHL